MDVMNDELPASCKESMRPVKKALKQLELLKDLPLEQQVSSTRTQVLRIGEHVSTCLAEYSTAQEARYWKRSSTYYLVYSLNTGTHNMLIRVLTFLLLFIIFLFLNFRYLWKFASIFSEHNARTLRRLYKYSQVNQEDKFMKTYWGSGFPGPAQVQSLECKQLYNAWGLPVDSSSSDLDRSQSAVEDQHLTDRHTDGSFSGSSSRKKEDPTQSDESQQDSPYSSSAVKPAQKSWTFPDPHDLKSLKIPRMLCGKEPDPSSASIRVLQDTAAADWLVVFQLPSDFHSLLRHFHYT
ncbi:chromodomain-helicase-DNA-binding protein 1-like [Polyodon spathula]|uniref:chromodomain-helicase-DNA-binding protein 1-like n=1 Tax=Polyodon spathula TaxID=7913 RepID=UPI001B7E02BF|nr:chromodomain-helicase-DNA-binding protein 1-like [Polyodon spathula]